VQVYWVFAGVVHGIFETVENIIEKRGARGLKNSFFQFPFKSKTTEHHQKVETSL